MTELLIRLLDIVGSLVGLVLALPVIVLAAMLIGITSGRPVLFRQERVGLRGRCSLLYKFRTMINDAEKQVGPVWASRNDNRVTPIGRILRKTRLDELPQLFNILRGDMSLVGPRPERPFFVDRHKALQGVRLTVKPGLTGLAQIRGLYDLKPAHKVRYDCLYIQKRCLLLNLYILLRTIPALFIRRWDGRAAESLGSDRPPVGLKKHHAVAASALTALRLSLLRVHTVASALPLVFWHFSHRDLAP